MASELERYLQTYLPPIAGANYRESAIYADVLPNNKVKVLWGWQVVYARHFYVSRLRDGALISSPSPFYLRHPL